MFQLVQQMLIVLYIYSVTLSRKSYLTHSMAGERFASRTQHLHTALHVPLIDVFILVISFFIRVPVCFALLTY